MFCKKGFTLIELLVVVIIIAVLAAIALPQYHLAVEKTRATERLQLATHIARAQFAFYLTNNAYATTLEQLDVSFPGYPSATKNLGIYPKNAHGEVEVKFPVTSQGRYSYSIFVGLEPRSYSGGMRSGTISCGPSEDDIAQKVCSNLCNGSAYNYVNNGRCIIGYMAGQ